MNPKEPIGFHLLVVLLIAVFLVTGCPSKPERSSDCSSCGLDTDGDGISDALDNCQQVFNPDQQDTEGDGEGDACDPDDDGDSVLDESDNCPLVPNPSQLDTDQDGVGDTCAGDDDGDGVADESDNCPLTSNPLQLDTNQNGEGDACDPDDDGDSILDPSDNCPLASNPLQLDTNQDGEGDACDSDDDGDGVPDGSDNCPLASNPAQEDWNQDGIGDACDPDPVLPDERHFRMQISPGPVEGMSDEETLSLVGTIGDGILISHFIDWDGTAGTYATLESLVALARKNGLEVNLVVEVAASDTRRKMGPFPESFTNPESPEYIPPEERTFENATLRQIIKDWCILVARDFQPAYMTVGVETDMYAFPNLYVGAQNPDAVNFVSLYKEIYEAIKQPGVSPTTTVFTHFQYEHFVLLELGGYGDFLDSRWDYVEMFDGYLDLFSISSFPVAIPEYVTPALIPDDYYGMVQERVDIPFALSETGWPSSGEGPEAQYRNEATQAHFVYRILELTEALDLRMLNWFFLSDPAEFPGLNPIFASGGLLEEDGTPKQAFDTWQELYQVGFTESAD